MTPAEKPQFAAVIVGLAAVKPGGKVTPEALEIWWMALSSWSLEEFKQAASHLALSIEFMPSPFHFDQLRKAGKPTSGEAWIKARLAVRNANWSDIESTGFTCGDPLIDRAVRAIGGYRAIGMCDSDKLHFLEKRFAEHLETMGDADQVREAVPQIATDRPRQRLTGPQRAILGLGIDP
jgi:hypothetical protein